MEKSEIGRPSPVDRETVQSKQNGSDVRVDSGDGLNSPTRSRSRSTSRESRKSMICRLEEVPQTRVAKFQTVVQKDKTPRSMQQEVRWFFFSIVFFKTIVIPAGISSGSFISSLHSFPRRASITFKQQRKT